MKVKTKGWIILVLGLIMAGQTGRNVVRLYQAGNRVKEAQKQLEGAKAKNEQLTKRLAEVNSPEFVEREAREKLGYGKEGEVMVILPDQDQKGRSSFAKATEDLPNWKRWWDLYVRI